MSLYSDETKQTFLDALAKTGVIAVAMGAAGIKQRSTIASWRKDELFDEAYRDALEDAADSLEAEARRRAAEGVVKVQFYPKHHERAGQAYDEIQYSDSLILALLKAKKPNEYAERTKAEITSPDGSLRPENTTAAAARLLAILEEAKQRKKQAETEEDELLR